jgi:hypothetical protein
MNSGVTHDDAVSALAIDAQIEYDAAERVIKLLATNLYTPYAHYIDDEHWTLACDIVSERVRKFKEEENAEDQGVD